MFVHVHVFCFIVENRIFGVMDSLLAYTDYANFWRAKAKVPSTLEPSFKSTYRNATAQHIL
jgi:hypothetical protein